MQRYQQQSKAPVQLNTKFVGIGSSLLQAFLKSKMTLNKKDTVQIIKKFSQFNSKRTQVFVRLVSKIMSRKQFKNKKNVISSLLQNRISDILVKRQKLNQLKTNSRNNSLSLISSFVVRNLKQKMQQAFLTLKSKSLFKLQRYNFKIAALTNIIKKVQRDRLSDSLKKIKFESFRRLVGYKRCFVLQRLYLRKRAENIIDAFNSIFDFSLQKISNQIQIRILSQQQSQSQQKIIDEMQIQRSQLQAKLQQQKQKSSNLLKQLSNQLTPLQQQLESIRFEHDLNTQNNNQLQQTLKQRQSNLDSNKIYGQSGQKGQNIIARLLQGNNPFINNNNRQISESTLWQSVFNNLLLYLVKCKKANQKTNQSSLHTDLNQIWSQQKLLQVLTQPLTDIHLYPTTEELIQENSVLKQLLETYKQAYPEITVQKNSVDKLPAQILIKQRQFLIRSLQCLSKWGTQAGDGLQGVKSVLERIKEKTLLS